MSADHFAANFPRAGRGEESCLHILPTKQACQCVITVDQVRLLDCNFYLNRLHIKWEVLIRPILKEGKLGCANDLRAALAVPADRLEQC